MKINDFKKLADKLENQNFNSSYKTINTVLFVLSIFGHLTSIFLAYHLVSKVLTSAVENATITVSIATVILLGGLELLKRDFFTKLSFQSLKSKSFISKEVLPLLIVSLVAISLSFYASIKGAQEFSSKSRQLESNKKETIQLYTDSVNAVVNGKVQEIELEVKDIKAKINEKDEEQTELESGEMTYWQRNRVRDLKEEKKELADQIIKLETDIANIKTERDEMVDSYVESLTADVDAKKDENKGNSLLFVIISTIVELVILFGVYFNKYYMFKSYTDHKKFIETNANYQKWILYDEMLNTLYTKKLRINDKLPSAGTLADLCKVNGIRLAKKEITSFLKVLNGLEIIKTHGSSRYMLKSKEAADELLRDHFNIK